MRGKRDGLVGRIVCLMCVVSVLSLVGRNFCVRISRRKLVGRDQRGH